MSDHKCTYPILKEEGRNGANSFHLHLSFPEAPFTSTKIWTSTSWSKMMSQDQSQLCDNIQYLQPSLVGGQQGRNRMTTEKPTPPALGPFPWFSIWEILNQHIRNNAPVISWQTPGPDQGRVEFLVELVTVHMYYVLCISVPWLYCLHG